MCLFFLPGVPGTTAGLCVGNGCPVIEPVGDGCPVIEPGVDSVREAVLIILHSFNAMVVFT